MGKGLKFYLPYREGERGQGEPPLREKKIKKSFASRPSKTRDFFTYAQRDGERKEEEGK